MQYRGNSISSVKAQFSCDSDMIDWKHTISRFFYVYNVNYNYSPIGF